MKRNSFLYLGLILVIIGTTGAFVVSYLSARNTRVGCPMHSMMRGRAKTSFSSNGERIYYTATSNSGKPITATMGKMKMTRPMMACVDCHGKDGKGGTIKMPMGSFKAANITYDHLTKKEMPPFTDADIKKAITKGFEPSGAALKSPMPQWSMSKEDLSDLLNYLKTL